MPISIGSQTAFFRYSKSFPINLFQISVCIIYAPSPFKPNRTTFVKEEAMSSGRNDIIKISRIKYKIPKNNTAIIPFFFSTLLKFNAISIEPTIIPKIKVVQSTVFLEYNAKADSSSTIFFSIESRTVIVFFPIVFCLY